jgi:hypothetical protein
MGINTFVIVAGCIFGIVCLLQLARVIFRLPVRIASFDIPQYVSAIAVVVSGALCFWAIHLAAV